MDRMVDQCQLKATFPYLDNITICGHDWPDHNTNLQRFFQVAKALNLTYNRDKCVFGTTRLAILGKSATGTTLPAWLTSPGLVLLRKHVRSNKYSPLVERVHLLHANPQYAYMVLPDGWEDTVSVRDLAPAGAADHYPKHSMISSKQKETPRK
ncbi:cAMP-dependent protein kinase inhibitor alpha isoform X1 [Hemitrygon akajei]|uniref:cAMP-dependent protein kinase inhibitor alpha isoform X1 n=1 Tax=Hemitrygon akajei TaxID=2704970 RepID=UPI003BF97887